MCGSTFPILFVTAAAVAATVVALPAAAAPATQRAAAKPAESTRVLPDVATISSAVDNAGGSLVVGHSLHGSGPGVRAYYRTPSGTWRHSVSLLPETSFPGTLVETSSAAGPSGVYVIAMRFTRGQSDSVYVSVRSSTGSYSAPRLVSTSGRDDSADPRLRVATNEHGDAVVTQRDPYKIVRYTRSTGAFHGYFLPREDGEGFGSGLHKRDAVATMSSAGSIDITYGFPTGTDASPQLSIVQRTLTADSTTSTRRMIATAYSRTATFDIAMDGNGLQTLITNDGRNQLYREQNPRGPFVQRVEEVDAASSSGSVPHVAARGDFNRIDYVEYCGCDGEFNLTASRLYKGDVIVRGGTSSGAVGTDDVLRAMGIGLDGRGVEVTFGTYTVDDSSISEATVQRSVLGDPGRTDQIMSRGSLEPPALDVGRTSVSQLVIHEAVRSGDKTVRRTVVYIRR